MHHCVSKKRRIWKVYLSNIYLFLQSLCYIGCAKLSMILYNESTRKNELKLNIVLEYEFLIHIKIFKLVSQTVNINIYIFAIVQIFYVNIYLIQNFCVKLVCIARMYASLIKISRNIYISLQLNLEAQKYAEKFAEIFLRMRCLLLT